MRIKWNAVNSTHRAETRDREASCVHLFIKYDKRGHLNSCKLIIFTPTPSPRGYMFAGLEFGAECYCGHKIQAPNASESECNMECKGEKSNLCGGANRLSIYRLELSQESARRCESAKRPLPSFKRKGVLGLSEEASFS